MSWTRVWPWLHQPLGFFFCFNFYFILEYTGDSVVKNPPANAGDVGSIPGLEKSPGED